MAANALNFAATVATEPYTGASGENARTATVMVEGAARGEEVQEQGRPVAFARVLQQNVAATGQAVPGTFPAGPHAFLTGRLSARGYRCGSSAPGVC